MRLTAEIRYPAAPSAVVTMLLDPRFHERTCVATGALRHRVEVTGDGAGAFSVTRVRTMPTTDVPAAARRFVGPTLEIHEVLSWGSPGPDGSRTGTLTADLGGLPMRLTGTIRLSAAEAGAVQEIDGDLRASVPLVGGTLERAAEPALQAAVRREAEVAADWLTPGAGTGTASAAGTSP